MWLRDAAPSEGYAWFLEHPIREAMTSRGGLLGNTVEVDEAYMGGKEKNKHASKRENTGGGTGGKQAVVGMKERSGEVRAFPVDATTEREGLQAAVEGNVERGSNLYTDGNMSYRGLPGCDHAFVRHSAGEYVRGAVHTNGIESFWSPLKRGYIGVFHYMSKHLPVTLMEILKRLFGDTQDIQLPPNRRLRNPCGTHTLSPSPAGQRPRVTC